MHGVVGVPYLSPGITKMFPANGCILCIAIHDVRSYRTTADADKGGNTQGNQYSYGTAMNLTNAIKALPYREKEMLYNHLGELLQEEKSVRMKEMESRMQTIMKEICAAMGISEYNSQNRQKSVMLARVIIANILLLIGGTETSVGKVMGKHHATIHYYKNLLEVWQEYPRMYREELELWNQMKTRYEIE